MSASAGGRLFTSVYLTRHTDRCSVLAAADIVRSAAKRNGGTACPRLREPPLGMMAKRLLPFIFLLSTGCGFFEAVEFGCKAPWS
jgi:hypothetical protein